MWGGARWQRRAEFIDDDTLPERLLWDNDRLGWTEAFSQDPRMTLGADEDGPRVGLDGDSPCPMTSRLFSTRPSHHCG